MHRKNLRIESISDVASLVPLTRGLACIVDTADLPLIESYSWSAGDMAGFFYARTTLPNDTKVFMHRLLLGSPPGLMVDHVNGFTLDNRRTNLREALAGQNSSNTLRHIDNTSGYKGVTFVKTTSKWRAQIGYQRKVIWIGDFDDPIDAAHAYDAKAVELRGRFARINFPERYAHLESDAPCGGDL